jgi:acetyltransferase-like isoleucine patch superfamily enzyme
MNRRVERFINHYFGGQKFALRRFLGYPPFAFEPDARRCPEIEPLCTFEHAHRIRIGEGVRFLRGAVVLADEVGEITIGPNSTICRYAIVQSVGGAVQIGARSCVGDFCNLYGQGGLTIGNDVMISFGVRIIPNSHTFSDPERTISAQKCTAKGIRIGDGVWIGANAVILDGVEVGNGAIIGAGAVVNRSVDTGAIVAGVPARTLRYRPGFGQLVA